MGWHKIENFCTTKEKQKGRKTILYFLVVLGIEFRASHFARQVLYHLSHFSSSIFVVGFF
jgi:hypothetical protein